MSKPIRHLGLISDTHGLLREEAVRALQGSDLILHAGDVGAPEILSRLRDIAPVLAVRGNVDEGSWAEKLPMTQVVEAAGATIYMLHILEQLDLDPRAAGFAMVISGHSHQPGQSEKKGVLYVNPGSAGPRRFRLPITIARVELTERPWKIEFVDVSGKG